MSVKFKVGDEVVHVSPSTKHRRVGVVRDVTLNGPRHSYLVQWRTRGRGTTWEHDDSIREIKASQKL